jgi:1,3-beta-glucan synthase
MNSQLSLYKYDTHGNQLPGQQGCYNLALVFDWIKRCIISIFLVFITTFLPLFLQSMINRYRKVCTN